MRTDTSVNGTAHVKSSHAKHNDTLVNHGRGIGAPATELVGANVDVLRRGMGLEDASLRQLIKAVQHCILD